MIVKVCGMREAQNIREVEALGIDLMGFIFYPRSPRYCAALPDYLPTGCKRVGVFVNASIDDIRERAASFGLDYIQLHGNETPDFTHVVKEQTGCKIIKAFSIGNPFPGELVAGFEGEADLFLFDTPTVGFGGSGQTFDHSLLAQYTGNTPFLLSGGIGPDFQLTTGHEQLAGLDLNSRFETEPGLKDTKLLRSFISKLKTTH